MHARIPLAGFAGIWTPSPDLSAGLFFPNRSQTFTVCSQTLVACEINCAAELHLPASGGNMKRPISKTLLAAAFIFSFASVISGPLFAQNPTPTAIPPYQLSIFATAPAGLSAPDSVAVRGDQVFVGYGDNHAPDGSDGLSSQVVQYNMKGHLIHIYTVLGHNDGIKINPATGLVWALQNEDANANLVIVNPETKQQKFYTFGPTLHGGGYDDLVFRGCQVFISASNPANTNPNTGPAIVRAHLSGTMVEVDPVLAGDASAIDISTDQTIQLNLTDPDSMTLDPLGNLVLDSQGDDELIFVSDPNTKNQRVLHLPLTYLPPNSSTPTSVEVDDTSFTTSSQGFILFADKTLNTVYRLDKVAFPPETAFIAADGASLVGTINPNTGLITPIVTGLGNPGGLVFVDTSNDQRTLLREAYEDECGDGDYN
jgi:hypothetical protein